MILSDRASKLESVLNKSEYGLLHISEMSENKRRLFLKHQEELENIGVIFSDWGVIYNAEAFIIHLQEEHEIRKVKRGDKLVSNYDQSYAVLALDALLARSEHMLMDA